MRMGSLPANASTNSDVPWYVKAIGYFPPFLGITLASKAIKAVNERQNEAIDKAVEKERVRVSEQIRTEILGSQVPVSNPERSSSSLVPLAVAGAIALILLGSRKRG